MNVGFPSSMTVRVRFAHHVILLRQCDEEDYTECIELFVEIRSQIIVGSLRLFFKVNKVRIGKYWAKLSTQEFSEFQWIFFFFFPHNSSMQNFA